MSALRCGLLAAVLALLAACAPEVRPPQQQREGPADFPRAYYEAAATRGEKVYRIDPTQSLVVIEVRRGGSLARLGHDHVVAARNLAGYVAPDASRADLYVVLDGLSVDEAGLRAAAGFETQPSESDIAGTRANMLDKVLETGRFPYALVRVNDAGGRLTVAVNLHGVTRTLEVPAELRRDENEFAIAGRLAFNQTDFDIVPFSILGGAIRVEDRLELKFTILARPGAAP